MTGIIKGLPVIKDNHVMCWCYDSDGVLITDNQQFIEYNLCYKHRAQEQGFIDWLFKAASEMEAQQQKAELYKVSTQEFLKLDDQFYGLKHDLRALLDEYDN